MRPPARRRALLEKFTHRGRHLRYVAEADGKWMAILTFSGAAPHLKAREKRLGWSPRQRARRLGFIINSSRFLQLLARERHPNLASKVLSLAMRRVAQDWQESWGQRPLVVESFVDETIYRGTCYTGRAGLSKWEPARGFPVVLATTTPSTDRPRPFICGSWNPERARYCAVANCPPPSGMPRPKSLACAAVATLLGAGNYQGYEDAGAKSPAKRAIQSQVVEVFL